MNYMKIFFNLFFVQKLQIIDDDNTTASVKDYSDTCQLRNHLDETWSKLTYTKEMDELGKYFERDSTEVPFVKSGKKITRKVFYGISAEHIKRELPSLDRTFQAICETLKVKDTRGVICENCGWCFSQKITMEMLQNLPSGLQCSNSDDRQHSFKITPAGLPQNSKIIKGYRIKNFSPSIPAVGIQSGL